MLKFVIVGLIFTTVSSAPLESVPTEKHADSHKYVELIRPSPINPDIPMDPKPPERIILDDENERDSKSLDEKAPIVENESHENLKSEAKDSEPSGENNEEKKLNEEKTSEKSADNKSDGKSGTVQDEKTSEKSEENKSDDTPVTVEDEKVSEKSKDNKSDDKSGTVESKPDNVSAPKTIVIATDSSHQTTKSDEPIIVYAVKPDEKQRSENFQTSHRIPNIGENERQFQTSHHIPAHIESERQKSIETAKVGEKDDHRVNQALAMILVKR